MLRLCFRTQCSLRSLHRRRFSSPSSSSSQKYAESHHNLNDLTHVPPSAPTILQRHPPDPLSPISPASSLPRYSVLALCASVVSALVASIVAVSSDRQSSHDQKSSNPLYDGIEQAVHKSGNSFKRIFHHVKQTGVAASVLWQSLSSVLSNANHEVISGFELRVAALLADIAAANANRRAAIVGAGGGAVVDWLLDSVAFPRNGCETQAESARALAYLIADPTVSASVLGRRHAVPNLLRFIFSCQPQRSKKEQHLRRSSFDVSDSLKGRSMLVAAIMDIVTSNCDGLQKIESEPFLPKNAETRDIAAALQVIEDGGLHLDEPNGEEDDSDGNSGIKGIGIKVLGGTAVVGLARTNGIVNMESNDSGYVNGPERFNPKTRILQNKLDNSFLHSSLSSSVIPGLWDDLHREHVAVPFAAWALAKWAAASDENRSRIQELDNDGRAVMTALMAPERSVKWHGSLVARLLLEDHNLSLNDSVSDWSSCLLSTVSQASKNEDIQLVQVAMSAFLLSVERIPGAQKIVMEKGLHLMRDVAKRTSNYKQVQEGIARALELLCAGNMHLSLEEIKMWSAILLYWIFGKCASETLQSSAMKILSCIFEDYGPASIPISQGWLAMLLTNILASTKTASVKGVTQAKGDKVKIQIDQSNVVSAGQITNQLAGAVVKLAQKQDTMATDPRDPDSQLDLLSQEPFMGPLKNLKKDDFQKFDAADSAIATLKGIKALSEICVDDYCQNKIVDLGVLCLLRRFLLSDDYEKLAAMEAYDASRTREAEKSVSNVPGESPVSDISDPLSVRVPPTAHIRRHAARLLSILSILPKVQKMVVADDELCKWLEDCASGKISGCSDLKLQSYARATLLHVFCNDLVGSERGHVSHMSTAENERICSRYDGMLFLINPALPHWKCSKKIGQDDLQKDISSFPSSSVNSDNRPRDPTHGNLSNSLDASVIDLQSESPKLDVIFVHGLRGGPFKSWRIAEDKSSTKSGLVEKIDQESGKLGTFWPGEWLSSDLPKARMFTLKYKTNLTQWSGASLPLQEVSSMLLEKLVSAGIGDRPVVFVTHSMGGLVVKQMLHKAKTENIDNLVNNTVGIVFYSCPHFGSKLADMPWRMGLVLRPAPTIGELRSGSPRLVELNDFIRHLHKKGQLEVLSFCETKVTPIVEGYGGWAFRMEIVPIESAYPGFGELVVLESTDHINSCKPLSRADPSYTETLQFLQKLKAQYT